MVAVVAYTPFLLRSDIIDQPSCPIPCLEEDAGVRYLVVGRQHGAIYRAKGSLDFIYQDC